MRIKWLKDGDRNTRFFHTMAKIKGAKSHISHIVIDGEVVTDMEAVKTHIVQLFSDSGVISNLDMVQKVIPRLVSEEEKCILCGLPDVEIKSVCFLSRGDKFLKLLFLFRRTSIVLTRRSLWGNMAIKADIRKALGKMRWDFLLEVLKSLSGSRWTLLVGLRTFCNHLGFLFWLTEVLLGGFLVAVVEFFVLQRRFLA